MLLDIIDLRQGMKILDVGCGYGTEIAELANLGANCIGSEAVEVYAKMITMVGKEFGLKVEGAVSDGCHLPWQNGSFDIVMSKFYFEHLKDFDLGIREQIRVLRDNGKLIVIDGNPLCPPTIMDILIKYPVRTRGKYGGLKWLLTKGRVKQRIYDDVQPGLGFTGKDEDIHTIFWWRRKMREYQRLEIADITTTKHYRERGKAWPAFLEPFSGGVLVIALKTCLNVKCALPRQEISLASEMS
jgi:SAM-dependent methyltransferase